jgi:hypothetical protein
MKRVAWFSANARHTRRWAAVLALTTASIGGTAAGHHPDTRNLPVRQPIDLIGPVGNRLPPGHRRVYNRPTYVGGKIAYWIAPSSQEAMAWHRAVHAGAYRKPKKHLRLQQHYFYAKPWQVLQVGPRRSVLEPSAEDGFDPQELVEDASMQVLPPVEQAVEPEFGDKPLEEVGEAELPALTPPEVESPSDVSEMPQSPQPLSPPADDQPEGGRQDSDAPEDGADAADQRSGEQRAAPAEDAGTDVSQSDVSESAAEVPSALYQPVLQPPLKGGGVKVDPNAGGSLFRRGGTRAMGPETSSENEASSVSRGVSHSQPQLRAAEKPSLLRGWWRR